MKVLKLEEIELAYPQSRFEKKKGMKPSRIGPISLEFFDSEVVERIFFHAERKKSVTDFFQGIIEW